MELQQPSRRACGECKACCTTCVVPELDKGINTPCVHLVQTGCGIYETRPESCRIYNCAWLHGHFADYERPDKTGIVWSFEEIEGLDGLLVHAMILDGSVPLERVQTMYSRLQKSCAHRLMLQIIPHDLRISARAKIHGKPVGPGIYVAVAEQT